MHLIVRDNDQGKRIEKWYIPAATLQASAQSRELNVKMSYSRS
jgi:hypothetical protein